MDKLKGVAKKGWHPPGDRSIHRDSWKSDIKGMATGKKKDPYEDARNHQSRPLGSLKDPDSFGAPPKHTGAYGSNPGSPTTPAPPESSGGWGSAIPAPSSRQQIRHEEEEEAPKPPPGPYKVDTSGLRTDNLPKPPVRRVDGAAPPATPPRTRAISSPPPALPTRQTQQQAVPTPSLPPRMTENPDEYTPPPPPTYNEATQPYQQDPAALNQGAINRLGHAGVSVPGFGIGDTTAATPPQSHSAAQGHTGQLSELQQRFARMNTTGSNQAPPPPAAPSSSNLVAAVAAHKKPPPPPPPKKAGLGSSGNSRPSSSDAGSMPPPLPLSSKPRPPP